MQESTQGGLLKEWMAGAGITTRNARGWCGAWDLSCTSHLDCFHSFIKFILQYFHSPLFFFYINLSTKDEYVDEQMVRANQSMILMQKLHAESFGLRRLKGCPQSDLSSSLWNSRGHLLRTPSSTVSPGYPLDCFEFIATPLFSIPFSKT